MVAWFAGLFYMPRLFIYDVEAKEKTDAERDILQKQLRMMSRRLWYIITWPGMVLTFVCGISMIVTSPSFVDPEFNARQGYYMYIKFGFLLLLIGYHFCCHMLYKQQQRGALTMSSTALRGFNEIATLLLIGIIFVVVFKGKVSWLWGSLGLLGTAIAFSIAIKLYKRYRDRNPEH